MTAINTIAPPNSYNMQRWHGGGGVLCASSFHQGGAHILMGDGAVIFMTDSVEAGDQQAGMVWLNGTNRGPSPPSNVMNQPIGMAVSIAGIVPRLRARGREPQLISMEAPTLVG